VSISIDDPIRLGSTSEAWRPDSYSPQSLASPSLEADIELALQQAGALIQELGKAHSALGASRVEGVYQSLARVGKGTLALAATVRQLSAPRSRFGASAFLDAIESAYRCLTNANPGPTRVVRLVDVWELLTLRPGSRSEYSKAEFGRDLKPARRIGSDRHQCRARHPFSGVVGYSYRQRANHDQPRRPAAHLLGGVLLMTDPIHSNDYAGFLAKEYLLDYIRTGGGAVKFSVGPPGALEKFASRLRAEAHDNNYLYASIDAAHTKISMTDHILFALTPQPRPVRPNPLHRRRRLPSGRLPRWRRWPTWADVAEVANVKVQTVAAHHHIDPGELHRSVRRRLEHTVLDDRRLPR